MHGFNSSIGFGVLLRVRTQSWSHGCIQGFDALRILSEQYHLEQCSSSATTQGVHVEITTACIGSRIPLDLTEMPTARPVWTYRIRIENVG